ncbi:MAG: penicillin acylase family protein [Bacteroidota bacterium]
MKTFRFVLFLIISLSIGIVFNSRLVVSGQPVPPLGKFLSPFHGFWQNAENDPIDLASQLNTSGLQDPVKVHFDELYIPHIFASNDEDLFFTQGYITAYHRLWQMEFQLLAAEGRVSEIIGSRALNFDRSQRRIGLKYGAQKSHDAFKKEEPETYKMIEAYSAGVNAFINTLSYADYPVEYKILDYAPEEWSPFKCFLLISNMHNMLSRGERDLEHTNAITKWGRDVFEMLYPERPLESKLDPVIPRGTEYNFDAIAVEKPNVDFPLNITNPTIDAPDPDNGSNSFVVNGKKTKSGKVILANEPDLSLNLPSIWYVAHLNGPGINVMGATLPGSPGITIGYNDSIAWGNTNAKRDLVDWYTIDFKDAKRKEYLYNGNWVPTNIEVEKFEVKGEDPFYDTIVYTHHGPVTYDRNFSNQTTEVVNLAMKWTAHLPSKELKTLIAVGTAKNYAEFVEVFSDFTGPPQNYSFASTTGDIALWIHGKFPLKWDEQGKFLMDGSKTAFEWNGMMPQSHNLHVINPPQNFLSSANQHAADTLYPYYQYDHNYEYYRGRRVNDRLRIMSQVTVKDMMNLQHDNFNYNAFEILSTMLDSLDTASFIAKEWEYYEKLRAWDFFNHPEREGPSIYEQWWKNLNNLLWDEIDSSDVKVYRPSWFNTSKILLKNADFEMVDDQRTDVEETTGDLFRISFKQTIEDLEEFQEKTKGSLAWYEYKNTTVRHLLGLMPFSFKQIKIGGNRHIVNAASNGHGPSWRMVVELGEDEISAWGIYPGSQSGNPGNPLYGHMIDGWADGTYHKMLFKSNLSEESEGILYTVNLQPEE